MKSKYLLNFLLTLTIIVGALSSPVLASSGRPMAAIPGDPAPGTRAGDPEHRRRAHRRR